MKRNYKIIFIILAIINTMGVIKFAMLENYGTMFLFIGNVVWIVMMIIQLIHKEEKK